MYAHVLCNLSIILVAVNLVELGTIFGGYLNATRCNPFLA